VNDTDCKADTILASVPHLLRNIQTDCPIENLALIKMIAHQRLTQTSWQ